MYSKKNNNEMTEKNMHNCQAFKGVKELLMQTLL